MPSAGEERRRWRMEYVGRFLAEFGLVLSPLANSTQECLDEWARQAKLVEDQPSSNFGNVILQLCMSVESELASGLATIKGLAFLATGTLGQKAFGLRDMTLDSSARQQVITRRIKPGFVMSDLPRLMSALARLRSRTNAAHGNASIQSASKQDAARARQLAGQILQGIATNPGKASK